MRKTVILVSIALFGFLATVPARAQNLITSNPNFDTSDVSAWIANPPLSFVQDSSDAFGNVASGSGHATNTHAGSFNSGPNTCLPGTITAGNSYDLGATIRVPAGQSAVGFASISVYWYAAPGCGGAVLSANSTPAPAANNTWTLSKLTGLTAPATATSAAIYLFVNKTVVGGSFEAYFDRIFLGPSGTTPVALQNFQVD